MRRVICYIDGFNFYHAIKHIPNLPTKHIDLWALIQSYLKPEENLTTVNYFSAFATHRPTSYNNHKTYVQKLEKSGVSIIMGHFKKKHQKCYECGFKSKTYEEKETDVRIALSILEDAIDDKFDRAYIVSADSDLVPAVEMVKRRNPDKGFFILTPPGRYNIARNLRDAGHASMEITVSRIRNNLIT